MMPCTNCGRWRKIQDTWFFVRSREGMLCYCWHCWNIEFGAAETRLQELRVI